MGKKKLSLKPVKRGFATTSVPTRKAKEEAAARAAAKEEATEQNTTSAAETPKSTSSNAPEGAPNGDASAPPAVDASTDAWDDDKAVDAAVYQGLVDRLQEKAEKEVSRIVKLIDFDKRFATSFPRLEINEKIRDEALKYTLEDEEDAEGTGVKGLVSSPPGPESDKTLLRLFVTYQVLINQGFSEERVRQCILEGLEEGEGWVEALEWMWLHLSEEECRQLGEFAKPTEVAPNDLEGPLVDVAPVEPPPSSTPQTPAEQPASSEQTGASTPANPSMGGSLFQSLADSDTSESESDAEPDINKVNEQWATLMLQLDTLKIAAGAVKGKGKKGKGSGVVLETPEMVKLKAKITKVEKDYMFSRKDADVIFKAMKAKRDMQMLEAKLKNTGISPAMSVASSSAPATGGNATPSEAPSASVDASGAISDDEEGGMFGNMLDEPASDAPSEPSANTTVKVRAMPIPKQFSFTGNTPKALLRAALAKASKSAVLSYVRLSSNSRVARAGLEIRWTTAKRRVWKMEDLACESVEEAENYISTLALHELTSTGELMGVTWRTMPPAYRELWDELEVAWKDKIDGQKREVWKTVKELVDQKMEATRTAVERAAAKPTQAAVWAAPSKTKADTETYREDLKDSYEKRAASAPYKRMRRDRDTLPIAPFRQQIIDVLDKSQILVFSGETGCGKSTQLPAYILEDQLSKGKPCKIFVTEPRRISAISLAQRVSVELGDAPGVMGSNSSLVGYSIRLESKISANTRLAFVTNGIALRMLEGGSSNSARGSAFDEVTHIIVDEVHERSIESDFLLIVLKELLDVRKDLKVVLMSATVDAEKISDYFGGCPTMSVPGRTFPVNVNYLEDAVELTGWHIDESSPYAVWTRNMKAGVKQLEWAEDTAREDGDTSGDDEKPSDPTKLSSTRYSSNTVSTVNILDSRKIPYDLIVRLLERICFEDAELARFSPATLVFMPGLAEIKKLNDALQSHPKFGTGEFVIYPLHSTISSEGQSAVFQIPPQGVRKIVISTNIAETGVTIPDITCVIDSGKQREMRYDEKRQLSRLVETYIARSNAKQRRGRAGRVQEGLAFHLFTKARHDTQLAEHPIPEILRLSLQDLALRIKILKIKLGNTIEDALLRALDPPSSTNIQRAVAALVEVKALSATEEITPMGRLLSKLPMDVHLGKFLLVAALLKCLDPALTIAATLNSKSPFVNPIGFESQADAAKRSFAVGNSDFLTIANVFNSWRRASDNANFVRTFCRKNYLSHQTLQQIEELRQQLLAYLVDSSFVEATAAQKQDIAKSRYNRGFRTRFVNVPSEFNVNGENVRILGAALASGLYPKILSLDASGGMRTISSQQPVSIHPSSINFRVPKSEFGTNYLVYFNLVHSKKLYAWETGPVEDRSLALLCGDAVDIKVNASSLQLSRTVRFQVQPKTALALKRMREQFASAMSARLRGREMTPRQKQWFELAMRCIATGQWDDDEMRIGIAEV